MRPAAGAALVVLAVSVVACRDPRPAEYGAQLLACVEVSATRAEADACTDRVKAAWGRLDGGSDGQ